MVLLYNTNFTRKGERTSERKELHILHDDSAEKRSRSKWTRRGDGVKQGAE